MMDNMPLETKKSNKTSPSQIPIMIRPSAANHKLSEKSLLSLDCKQTLSGRLPQRHATSINLLEDKDVCTNSVVASEALITFPRQRVKASSSSLPIHELPGTSPHERIVAWVDSSCDSDLVEPKFGKFSIPNQTESQKMQLIGDSGKPERMETLNMDETPNSDNLFILADNNVNANYQMEENPPPADPVSDNPHQCSDVTVLDTSQMPTITEAHGTLNEYNKLSKMLHIKPVMSLFGDSEFSESLSCAVNDVVKDDPKIELNFDQSHLQPAADAESRIPSFQVIPVSKILMPLVEQGPLMVQSGVEGGFLSKVASTERRKSFSKPRNSSTYEDRYYRKQAFVAQGPTALRSNRDSLSVSKNQQNGVTTQQQAVLTRIITETITEYEVEDNQKDAATSDTTNNHGVVSKLPPFTTQKKTRQKNPKVTFVEEFVKCDEHCQKAEQGKCDETPIKQSKIPRLVLPGHGDPHLVVPSVKSPGRESTPGSTDYETLSPRIENKEKEPKFCKKCKASKVLLAESERTINYLQQKLAAKQVELVKLGIKVKDVTDLSCKQNTQSLNQSTSTTSSLLANPVKDMSKVGFRTSNITNPLLLKKEGQECTAHSSCAIPKFDLDGFIKKYFRHALSEDGANNKGPFQASQLLRLSVAARDCICGDLHHRLKSGYRILKQKYDIILSSNAATEADKLAVLDSYRRFVRFMYHYFDESLTDVEKFDQTFIDDCGKKYYEKASMVIDGKARTGVFIPNADAE